MTLGSKEKTEICPLRMNYNLLLSSYDVTLIRSYTLTLTQKDGRAIAYITIW